MSDEKIKLQIDAGRGVQARAILDNPIYQEAMVAMRGELLSLFEQTKFKDHAERDEIWRKLQIVGWFESYLTKVMQTGTMAEQSLMDKVKSRFVR